MMVVTYVGGSKHGDVETWRHPQGKAHYLYFSGWHGKSAEVYKRRETIHAMEYDVTFLVYALDEESNGPKQEAGDAGGLAGVQEQRA